MKVWEFEVEVDVEARKVDFDAFELPARIWRLVLAAILLSAL